MFAFQLGTLRGKHCRHPIAVMGVVDTFGPWFIINLSMLNFEFCIGICFDFFHSACMQKTTTNIKYSRCPNVLDAEVKRLAFGGFLLEDFFVFSAPRTHAVLSKVE